MWSFIALVDHVDLGEDFANAFIHVGFFAPSGSFEYELEVVVDGAVGEELEILEHDAHASSQERDIGGAQIEEVVASDEAGFAFEGEFGVECFEEAGFAAADTAYEVDELSLFDFEVYVAEDDVVLL